LQITLQAGTWMPTGGRRRRKKGRTRAERKGWYRFSADRD